MATLAETLTEIRKHMAVTRYHLSKIEALVEGEERVVLEDELAERGLMLESVEEEPATLRDSEYAYIGE